MSQFQKMVLGVGVALVLVVAIGAGVIIKLQLDAARQAEYERCLAARGFTIGNVHTREDLERLVIATEQCT